MEINILMGFKEYCLEFRGEIYVIVFRYKNKEILKVNI